MALAKRGGHWYGDEPADILAELLRYSLRNGYAVHHFADAVCRCGSQHFRLKLDDNEGVAVRTCVTCGSEHPIGDSGEYLADAELEECECPCGGDSFEISAGVSLYEGTEDVRWLYVGCRCPACGLVACYGDWKIGGGDYRDLLGRV
ncbi:MAG: hypothetical protein K2X91_13055 [Thermoleophilia bacterium]|nr:hypothetical protein [Thermoleophilia bacterium]